MAPIKSRRMSAAVASVGAVVALLTASVLPLSARAVTLRGASETMAHRRPVASSQQQMMSYFRKRKVEHEASLSRMMQNMTLDTAVQIVHDSGHPSAAVVLSQLEATRTESSSEPSGVDKAKALLNSMLEEVFHKYDLELDRCCDFEKSQSNLIEESKQDIAFFGGEAAEAREKILAAEQEIDFAKVKIPQLKIELGEHNSECKSDLAELNEELKVVLADISVMSMVLTMTECKAPAGQQSTTQNLLLLSCDCSGEEVLTFHDSTLAQVVSGLSSRAAQQLLQRSLGESEDMVGSDLQEEADEQFPNATATTPMPMTVMEPRTIETRTPCKSPGVTDKRTTKCSIKNNPNCEKLQERFLLIQAEMKDRRDELQEQIPSTEKTCESTRLLYEEQVEALGLHLKDFQTKLATATEYLSSSGEQIRLKSSEYDGFKTQWATETETCHSNFENLEAQDCGLKKIRAELFKMKSKTKTPFFQDCSVSQWEVGECSKKCESGTMIVTRGILSPPNNGMKCPPLSKSKACNTHKCPVDCKMEDWEDWSSCSVECGGGMRERVRPVKQKARYRGTPCGGTSEAEVCHAGACDAECDLSDWTEWSECSKMCGGGSQKRIKTMLKPATGTGSCAPADSEFRLERQPCHETPCKPKLSTLRCESELDVVLLLDGSGSIGRSGWEATKVAGLHLADAFSAHHADILMATVLYSGPSRWRDIENCGGDAPPFGWKTMFAQGWSGSMNEGKEKFNDMFHESHLGIVRRQCMNCARSHRDVYFRRYTSPETFDAWEALLVTWSDEGFHTDFDIFSNLNDALQGTNAWKACNGNDPGIGFPRDCDPSRLRGWQWESLTRGGQRNFKWQALEKQEVDMEGLCKIKFVNHFTNDTAAIKQGINDMEWPQGATLTAQALQAAEEELPLSGRPEAQSVVIVLTDGRPISSRKTLLAAEHLREKARLVIVPIARYAPRAAIKTWVSQPVEENIVDVNTWEELKQSEVVNKIISDVCPEVS